MFLLAENKRHARGFHFGSSHHYSFAGLGHQGYFVDRHQMPPQMETNAIHDAMPPTRTRRALVSRESEKIV